MVVLYKNPNLTDYFISRDDITIKTSLSDDCDITDAYEAGKVITFPNLKFDINFEFWSNLPTDKYPALKKLGSLAYKKPRVMKWLPFIRRNDNLLEGKLRQAEVPDNLKKAIKNETKALYDQLIPTYEAIFGKYKFKRRKAVWRLNTIYNENLHVDTYLEEYPDHFARLFINLDLQPRIWQTSYTVEEMFEHFGKKIDMKIYETGTRAQIWMELNKVAFGGLSKVWWDQQPRHVIYFAPGDVWAVDSRQVAHQIFYGRRALSVDFVVDVDSMKNPTKHYLNLAEDFRKRALSNV